MTIVPALSSSGLSATPAVRHGFFTRAGGVSTGVYESLNCRLGSSDDPGCVAENRARVASKLGIEPGRLMTAWQKHTATALIVDRPFEGERPEADALVTATPGLALGALSADCAPVLFASADGKVIAAAHAGWKGALTGILENTIACMEELGALRGHIFAAVGPCIAIASYEVAAEFRDRFLSVDVTFNRFFAPNRAGHFQFDLASFVRHRLQEAGIGAVEVSGLDTYSDAGRFFSYRRATHLGQAEYGTQISAIAIGISGQGC